MLPTERYPVTATKFAAYLAQLPTEGATVTPTDADHGQVGMSGYTLGYSYDGSAELTLTGIDKGFFSLPWSAIFSLIGEHLT